MTEAHGGYRKTLKARKHVAVGEADWAWVHGHTLPELQTRCGALLSLMVLKHSLPSSIPFPPHRSTHRHQSLIAYPRAAYICPSLSSALCLASSETLGFFKVALRPPATLLGFLFSSLEDLVVMSPPFSRSWRTSLECCLASSEVSGRNQ